MRVALGVAAIGAGLGIAYYAYKKHSQNGTDGIEVELLVEQAHVEWLEEVATKYVNGDTGDTLRKVIEHCKIVSTDEDKAQVIFNKVRCFSCGKKRKVLFSSKLSQEHISFIESAFARYKISGGQDKALRIMIEYAMRDAEESEVFGGKESDE